MIDETSGSDSNEGRVVFPGALSGGDKVRRIDPNVLARHQLEAESTYADLRTYINAMGTNYYDALRDVADRMDGGRRRVLIPGLQRPGSQEAKWTDRLDVRDDTDSSKYNIGSRLLYDKPTLSAIPVLRSYQVGIEQIAGMHEKGAHPHALVDVLFGVDDIRKITIDSRSFRVSSADLGQIVAKKNGVERPGFYGTETQFGSFLVEAFGSDWANNRFALELIFGQNPEIILEHKGGEHKKSMRSSYKFSTQDPEGNPEILFRGTVSPKLRKSFETPGRAGYQDRTIPIETVKAIYTGAMQLLPGKIVR